MKLLLAGIVLVLSVLVVQAEKKVVCYYGSWSTYRQSRGKFDVSDIDPFLCTHLIYTFFGISEAGQFRIIDSYLDLEENYGRGNIKKFIALKDLNPKLITLAAVGGWNEGSKKFSDMAKNPAKIQLFVSSTRDFLLKHGFDGFDLDWEYPGQRDGDPVADKENFITVLKALKSELSKYDLLLTAAVASAKGSAEQSYDIALAANYLDFINVMTYDLHGSWENAVGHNAPLYAGSNDKSEKELQLNADACIKHWISKGAPASKIILGTPLYGRSFTLQNPSNNTPGSSSIGPGAGGPYTNEPGMIGYNELCEKFKTENWTRRWDDKQKVPYAVRDRQWVGYDDPESIAIKGKFVNDLNLGGIMVWSIETDDFQGICGVRYPLLKKINSVIRPDYDLPESSERPHVPEVGDNYKCKADGIFRDPVDCATYHLCINGVSYNFKCPQGLVFDENLQNCNYPQNVDCGSATEKLLI